MKQLSKFQTSLFVIGGALMVIGVGCYVFMVQQLVVCWVFLLGSVLFATMGRELTVRRLKRIMNLADMLFVLSGILLADTAYANAGHSFFAQLFTNRETYITLLYNKWVVLLLIAAVLEVYTMHRIDHELSKKNIKE